MAKRPRNLTRSDLARIGPHVHAILGDFWTFETHTKQQCAESGQFDPPCAYAIAKIRGVEFCVDVDGEWYLSLAQEVFTETGSIPQGRNRFLRLVEAWRDTLVVDRQA